MSTFDGYVKEFPNIRIDYFRTHTDKPPPAAYFLSHAHSDHLLGLESLKMPFVYCSATTRRLLLRMEKYPHRINFAKGILESRKLHYRHLKLVLKALPLHVATELELGPKSKIRVTLVDANHCPGSVMFLIEDETKAILYTGDVRAESWWVHSIIQNPYLLPYCSGIKHLDCIYLDTTFSTREYEYRRFPTKSEGLKELLDKVATYPGNTVFYFRAWTLGYEQVWMALSNFLQSRVHVDDYQLNLFAGIVENGRDGYSMFEGPALAGFQVGNHGHSGCLTQDLETRLHSCEPGSVCHAELVKKGVVWVTPIISRLEDGTELLELGAGGGLGDLYQSAELEVDDMTTLEALKLLCKETLKDQEALEKIDAAMEAFKKSGSFKLSLKALGLTAEEEVPLKEFIRLVSKDQKWVEFVSQNQRLQSEASTRDARTDRTIHFPFSRHSSYQELRHLVSVFRPKDVCPCTVDMEHWTEELSMENLFGDLCSESIFQHDRKIEAEVEALSRRQELQNSLKRKRPEESQGDEYEDSNSPPPVFQSARASVPGSLNQGEQVAPDGDRPVNLDDTHSISQRPLYPPQTQDYINTADFNSSKAQMIKTTFYALNDSRNLITKRSLQSLERKDPPDPAADTPISLPSSAFKSQSQHEGEGGGLLQIDGMCDTQARVGGAEVGQLKKERCAVRQDAYKAASRSLWQDEISDWNDLILRSVGRKGHSEEEAEL